MEKKELVLARLLLKPRVKSLGFNKKELMGVAASIADNLAADEEASDEDVNAEIDKAIDAVIPILSLAQTQASRLMDSFKKKHEILDDDDTDQDDDNQKSQKKQKPTDKKSADDGVMEQLKALMGAVTKMQEDFSSFKGEKVTDLRKQKLEALLKDTGVFGTRTMKNFAKMSFDTDEEFDEYYSDVEQDLKDYNQERASAGLSALGAIPGAKSKQVKEEPFSDEEIAALAD